MFTSLSKVAAPCPAQPSQWEQYVHPLGANHFWCLISTLPTVDGTYWIGSSLTSSSYPVNVRSNNYIFVKFLNRFAHFIMCIAPLLRNLVRDRSEESGTTGDFSVIRLVVEDFALCIVIFDMSFVRNSIPVIYRVYCWASLFSILCCVHILLTARHREGVVQFHRLNHTCNYHASWNPIQYWRLFSFAWWKPRRDFDVKMNADMMAQCDVKLDGMEISKLLLSTRKIIGWEIVVYGMLRLHFTC